MKNVIKLSLTVLAGFVLSACGSGGGSSNAASTTVTEQGASTPNNSIPSNSTPPTTITSTGTVLIETPNAEFTAVSLSKQKINNSDVSTLNVDGKTFYVERAGFLVGGWRQFTTTDPEEHICCGKYENVRFGIFDEYEGKLYIFYNGNPTTDIPTAGTATYTGDAAFMNSIPKLEHLKDFITGTSQFNVDFGTKALTGTLKFAGVQDVSINANLSGNSFSGTATTAESAQTATVEGKFYGTQAKELGGLYNTADHDNDGWAGVFGAKKQ